MKPAVVAVTPNVAAGRGVLGDYIELSKPEVTSLILVAAAVGYCIGEPGAFQPLKLFHTILGTLLVAAGTGALNQYYERDTDALMRRTARRPLPAGRMAPRNALLFGIACGLIGFFYLWLTTNPLAASLALGTMVSYLLLYTPLKRRSTACTTVGALPGAVPPLIGWAAATGSLDAGAWVLFGVLFFWQFPHFLAIAWMYREDYRRAGIFMLPAVEPDGKRTALQVLLTSAVLIPVSLLPGFMGLGGRIYVAGALLLGVAFLYCGARLAMARTTVEARRLLHASVAYLPLLYGLLLLNRVK